MPSKKLFTPLLLIALLLAACADAAPPEPTPTPIPRQAAPTSPTYEVQRGDVTTQLQFAGRIAPVQQAELFFGADGVVRAVYSAAGDPVEAGQVLADLTLIDDLERQQALDALAVRRAEVLLDSARLRLERAEAADADRYERSLLQNEITLAEIALEQVQLGVTDVNGLIAGAQITAPFSGQLLSLDVAPGDSVAAFAAVALVADLSTLEVSAELRQAELEALTEGMPVTVSPANRPGDRIDGTIRVTPFRFGGSAGAEAGSTDNVARIALDVPPDEIGLNLRDRVDVTVALAARQDVLWLPPQAVRTFSGRTFVVVLQGEAEQRVDVELGLRSADRIEILSGLRAGQVVIGP